MRFLTRVIGPLLPENRLAASNIAMAFPEKSAAEREAWRRFLAGVFSQRRKQLGRSMRCLTVWPKQALAAWLGELGVDPAARPESLGPGELVRLFRALRLPAPDQS